MNVCSQPYRIKCYEGVDNDTYYLIHQSTFGFFFAAANLHYASIYVGSCRSGDHSTLGSSGLSDMNNQCNSNIGKVARGIIEVDCNANAIGRYVYFAPQQSSTRLNMCEIQVYGDDGKMLCFLFALFCSILFCFVCVFGV